jgi:hypothetical protein
MTDTRLEHTLWETKVWLTKLRDYLDTVDDLFTEQENLAWQHSDDALRQTFWWEVRKFEFQHVLPVARYYSFVTLLHAAMEERLRQLCLAVQNLDPTLHDFKIGNGLEDYMNFLEKSEQYGIKRIKLSSWRAITDFEKVRNCIVHAFGRIENVRPRARRHLLQLVKLDKNLMTDTRSPQSTQLMPTFEYCRNSVNLALLFFQELGNYLVPT